MRSREEIRDRLRELQRVERSHDYYGPYAKLLAGEIVALEWVLDETEPNSYDHICTVENS